MEMGVVGGCSSLFVRARLPVRLNVGLGILVPER
jgi:hypothetical protein